MNWPGIVERVQLHQNLEEFLEQRAETMGEDPDLPPHTADPFSDDTPLEASCDLENPETCDSCQ